MAYQAKNKETDKNRLFNCLRNGVNFECCLKNDDEDANNEDQSRDATLSTNRNYSN